MSQRARSVLQSIDLAAVVRERHPVLFAEYLRAGRSCLQLSRAIDRHRRRREPARREEHYEGDREAERVDKDWEDKQASKRAERWANATPNAEPDAHPHHRAETKPDLNRDRRSLRLTVRHPPDAAADAQDLYRSALERVATISTVAAGNPEPSRGGSSNSAPPRQQRLHDDPRWERHWGIVRSGLLLIHDLLDEAEGHGTRPVVDATTEEMNRLVLTEGRGLSCREAAAKLPEATGGQEKPLHKRAKVVERIRRMQGSDICGQDVLGYRVSTIDGERAPDAQGTRRVPIG